MATSLPVLFHLPISLEEVLALDGKIRFPATFEEFLEFEDEADYKVEYSKGKIIAIGHPTDFHEQICFNVSQSFTKFFSKHTSFRGYGSNFSVYLQATGDSYKPDVAFLNAPAQYIIHKVNKKRVKSVLNPFAVFEVFSDGTMNYDLTEKLPAYQLCPTLQYIIYIHQHKPFVTVYQRSAEDPNAWLSHDFVGMDVSILFEGQAIKVKKFYRHVIFMGNGKDAQ